MDINDSVIHKPSGIVIVYVFNGGPFSNIEVISENSKLLAIS